MKKSILLTILLIFIFVGSIFASTTYYETGDQSFSFKAGINVPLFINFPVQNTTVTGDDMKTKLGGYGSINYASFVTPKISIGAELGYSFNYTIASEILTTVPIMVTGNYYIVQTGKFDLVTGIGLGAAFTKYDSNLYLTPLAEATVTPSFYFTENWGVGVETGFTSSLEYYGPDNTKPDDTAITGFMPISLKMSYRH